MNNNEAYKIIFDSLPYGIFYFDKNGIVLDCNKTFLKSINSTKELMIGFDTINKLQNKEVIQEIKKCIKTGNAYYEGPYISVTGKKQIISKGIFKAVYNDKGDFKFGICTLEDTTEQHEQKQNLIDLNNEYATLNEAFLEQNEELQQINIELTDNNKSLKKEKRKNLELINSISVAEQNYRTIFYNSPAPMVVHLKGRIVLANDAALQFLNIKEEKIIIGLPVLRFVYKQSIETAKKNIDKVINGESTEMKEERFVTYDGQIKNVLVNSGQFIYNGEKALLVAIADITELKQAEAKLEKLNLYLNDKNTELEEETAKNEEILAKVEIAERNYRVMFNNSPLPMAVHHKGKIVLYNTALASLLKIPDDVDFNGEMVFDFIHESSREIALDNMTKIAKGIKTDLIEEKFVKYNGEIVDVLVNSVQFNYNNQISVLTAVTDVSELKEAKTKLENLNEHLNNKNAELEEETAKNEEILAKVEVAEKNYRTIFNSSPIPMAVSHNGNILMYNTAAQNLLEVPEEESFNNQSIFNFIHDSSKKDAKENIDKILKGIKTDLTEEKFVTYTGKLIDVLVNSEQFSYNNQMSILTAFADISELKISKIKLQELNKELSTQNKKLKEETQKNKEILIQLANTERNYRTIFNNSPIPIIVHLDGKFVYVNDEAVKFIKLKNKEQVLGKSILQYIHPDSQEFAKNNIKRVLAGEKAELVEEKFITITGETRNVLLNTGQFIYENKIAIVAAFIDITDIKKSEEKLKIISKGIETSPASVVITDQKGTIQYINPKFSEITGYTEKEAIGINPRILKSGKHTKDFYKKMWKTLSNGENWRGELCNIKKNGDVFWEYGIISAIKDDNGKITNYIAIKEDITKRKDIEQKLITNEKYFKTLYDTAPDGIFEINAKGIITNCNVEFANSVKLRKSELIGRDAIDFIKDKVLFKLLFKQLIEEGFIESEIVQENGDGSTTIVWRKAIAMYNKNNDFVGAIAYNREITEIKEVEKQLIEAKEKAEESDNLKTAFLSNMSHEIRTPLNAIVGFTELLSKQKIDSIDKKRYSDYIKHNSKLLLNLINDIVDVSKIEANQIKISKIPVAIESTFVELYQMFLKEHTINSNVTLKLDIQDKNVVLNSDEYRLRQIITNLLSNAIKFTEKGEISFGYYTKKDKLIIFVKDTGEGINKDFLSKIFERFFKLGVLTNNKSGTGLGLSIVKSLTELLGGEITVNSEKFKGTEFKIIFPYDAKLTKIQNNDNEDYELSQFDWSNKTILIAEDDEFNFIVLEEYLKISNINIIHAKNGIEAIKLFKENKDKINLILMDIQMPELDGYSSTKEILKIDSNAKIIAQTAFAMSDEKNKSLEIGCVDYITKPIDVKTLTLLLANYLR